MNDSDLLKDADYWLHKANEEETLSGQGRLKIFFGMAAGVGKTYTMLQEAHVKQKEGIDVIVGNINTHGRADTEKMLEGLPVLPLKEISYKGKFFPEMDLEGIIQRKPTLVLIDELAHSNIPGSKHAKRWEDVLEIMSHGIDVYTTLNVQHLESRKDLIENLADIEIHETVPDLILEKASDIEIVDITPSELLQRLKEGKVYLGEQSTLAAEHFFKEDRLTALREIALRFTAEKVDHDLHKIQVTSKGWKTRERLMVAISPAPSSQMLIRSTRRLAFELDAPWIVLHIDTGAVLDEGDKTSLEKHLKLAKDLGAEVIEIQDENIARAIERTAKEKEITRLVLGRPKRRTWLQKIFGLGSLLDEIEEGTKEIDVLIMREDKLTTLFKKTSANK